MAPPDLPALLLALAEEIGASRPRGWGDSVGQTLRLIGLRLPPRHNLEFSLVDARQVAGAERRSVSPATVRRLAERICRDAPPDWLLASSHVVTADNLDVVRLPAGAVVQFGTVPVAVAGDGRSVVRDASGRYAPLLHFSPFDLAGALDRARTVPGSVFLLSDDIWPPNFSHWLLDTLPRLAALELSGFCRDDVVLATSPLLHGYQRETLLLCGWDASRIVELAPMQALRAGALLVTTDQPQPPHPMFKGAPWAARYLRRRLGLDPAPGRADPAAGRRLYLSRGDAGWRRVLNEPDLFSMLARLGFENVSLTGMSVREQAALFDGAAFVVAPHGAGLANVVFCRPGATVLEIFPFSFGTPAFHYVAAAGGLRYACHVVPQSAVVSRDGVGYDDFVVDPAVLAERYADVLPAGLVIPYA